MSKSNRIFLIIGLLLAIGIGVSAFFIREPAEQFTEDMKSLGSVLVVAVDSDDETNNDVVIDVVTDAATDAVTNEQSVTPPYVSHVPKDEFPEGPVPIELSNFPGKRVVEERSVEEIRNGWAFLYWFFYSAMMRDIDSAREYTKDPGIADAFFVELLEEGVWGDKWYYPIASNMMSFNDSDPEDGVIIEARINNSRSSEGRGIGVSATIQFSEGRWWIASIHTE